jgi:phospholipid/cholesterol/gamma-HCH transport system ATP-binding protein
MTDHEAPPVQLEQLSYAIDGSVILDSVDLSVARGEIVGIMGRSGQGKTTLLRLIIGLIRPTGGRVLIDGADITGIDEAHLDRLRLGMGLVFQGAALFDSMTVAENVAFALVEHRRVRRSDVADHVRELLAMVDMSGSEALMPSQLSGGMQKRVGVARALALRPSIMLYDEPTAGLDPISAAAIGNLIGRLREEVGATSIIVSHNVPSLRAVCDRAAVIHGGRFLASGPIEELEASADAGVRQFLSGDPRGPLTEDAGASKGDD